MKEQLFDELLCAMQGKLTQEQISELRLLFYLKLEDYEITRRCTEVALDDSGYLEYMLKFLTAKKVEGKSEGTLLQYKVHLQLMLETIRKPIQEIKTEDLFVYLAKYQAIRKIKNSSLDHKRRVFSTFFGWLSKKKYIGDNPTLGLEAISVEKILRKPFNDEERERLRCACKTERDLAIIELLYSTGMRVGELVKLNKRDIQSTNDIIVFGKGNKEREVYMNASARLHIENYLQSRTDGSPALFASQKNPEKRLKKTGVQKLLKRLGKEAGVDNVHPHRFRRTTITNALNRGMPVQEVRILAGHSNMNTTMIYFSANKNSIRHSCSKYLSV